MLKLNNNLEFRNVEKNALKNLELFRNSVFFGINGTGKSTIGRILAQSELCSFKDANGQPVNPTVHLFNDDWIENNVGEFVAGGASKGVYTVRIVKDVQEIESQIEEQNGLLKEAEQKLENLATTLKNIEEEEQSILNEVANGERQRLAARCNELSSRKFNRTKIKSLLDEGGCELLASDEVERRLGIATAESPGMLPTLGEPPRIMGLEAYVSEELTKSNHSTDVGLIINSWVKEGMATHEPGDQCGLCGNVVTAERLEKLKQQIEANETATSTVITEAKTDFQNEQDLVKKYLNKIDANQFSDALYSRVFEESRVKLEASLKRYQSYLKEVTDLIQSRIDSGIPLKGDSLPKLNLETLEEEFKEFRTCYDDAVEQTRSHNRNCEESLSALRSHCCASVQRRWTELATQRQTTSQEQETQRKNSDDARAALKALQGSVEESTTEDVARFLDTKLQAILGDDVLRISVADDKKGYKVERRGNTAGDMSGGERKLIALLYFCGEFLAEDRKEDAKNSVVIFDDIGSELDDGRLLSIDRFISGHFGELTPLSVVYLTHSHAYLRILLNRLRKNTKTNGSGRPKAVFYEVYKSLNPEKTKNTQVRSWDKDAINLTNDYWLAFFIVLRDFRQMIDGNPPSLGVGNFCRKVLEGFTEFRSPTNELFGSRLDELAKKFKEVKPEISKLVNDLSHTTLDRNAGVLSRNEAEVAVRSTLGIVRCCDEEHFHAILKRLVPDDLNTIVEALAD